MSRSPALQWIIKDWFASLLALIQRARRTWELEYEAIQAAARPWQQADPDQLAARLKLQTSPKHASPEFDKSTEWTDAKPAVIESPLTPTEESDPIPPLTAGDLTEHRQALRKKAGHDAPALPSTKFRRGRPPQQLSDKRSGNILSQYYKPEQLRLRYRQLRRICAEYDKMLEVGQLPVMFQ